MSDISEALTAKNQFAADAKAGVDTLSLNQSVTFTKYIRTVLPLDGFVFWVRADLLSASALANTSAFNAFYPNQPRTVVTPAPTLTVMGSMHYATDQRQTEDSTYAANHMIFTAEGPVQNFNQISPNVIFIGDFDGRRFAFSRRAAFYRQAGLWHYTGDAVYSTMDTQIIDDVAEFNSLDVVVSNSLPIWLKLNALCPVYPSFAVPDNLPPPYAAVHVIPEETYAIQSAPYVTPNNSRYQLARDKVRITTFGLRNNAVLDYVYYLEQATLDPDNGFGLMNMPVPRDDKLVQSELSILAQRKTTEFEVNYYQARVLDLARQLILEAIPTYIIDGYVPFDAFPTFRFYEARNSFNLALT